VVQRLYVCAVYRLRGIARELMAQVHATAMRKASTARSYAC
jgi:hypothetical protein